ncbi:CHAT domain-containing protein [Streptomyces sp. NPDC057011]|uniref:CHAT domain-containing protein n=1 Tax=unclassified Streptomyces TaxID=2593676 RepID=UPI0036389229
MELIASGGDVGLSLKLRATGLRALARTLTDEADSIEFRELLGRIHWYRSLALTRASRRHQVELGMPPTDKARRELETAVAYVLPALLGGRDIPEKPLALLAADTAIDVLIAHQSRLATEPATDPDAYRFLCLTWANVLRALPGGNIERPVCRMNLGRAAQRAYALDGRPADLDTAVAAFEAAAAELPPGDPDVLTAWAFLGSCLRDRFAARRHMPDLDRAVEVARQASTAPWTTGRSSRTLDLTAALGTRAEFGGGRAEDLDESVDLLQGVLDEVETLDPDRLPALASLSWCLRLRYQRTRTPSDLDRAVRAGREAVDRAPDGEPWLPARLHNLAIALRLGYERSGPGAARDLRDAVVAAGRCLDLTAGGHHDRLPYLLEADLVGGAALTAFGSDAALDFQIRTRRLVVAEIPLEGPARASVRRELASWLRQRFERSGARTDLDDAIETYRTCVAEAGPEHPEGALMLANLSTALWRRFERSARPDDIDAAVQAAQSAYDATPREDEDKREERLSRLFTVTVLQVQRRAFDADGFDDIAVAGREHGELLRHLTGQPGSGPADAQASTPFAHNSYLPEEPEGEVEPLRLALTAASGSGPHRVTQARIALADALTWRYEHTRAADDLDEAIELYRAAQHPERLGLALRRRAEDGRGSRPGDWEAAIAALRTAMERSPAPGPARAWAMSRLATTLRSSFDRSGGEADLDEAVALSRRAVTEAPDEPALWANLSNAHHTRYARHYDPADLDAAVTAARTAVESSPEDSLGRITARVGLGTALFDRYRLHGNRAELDEAIEALWQPVHPDTAMRGPQQLSLSNALRRRHLLTADRADLDRAIDAAERSTAGLRWGAPNGAAPLANVASLVLARFRDDEESDPDDLVRARLAADMAVAVASPGSPDRAHALLVQGECAETAQREYPQARAEAVAAYTESAATEAAPVATRIVAARRAVELLAGDDPHGAADVLGRAVTLLPLAASRRLTIADRQRVLRDYGNLASDAAGLRLNAGCGEPGVLEAALQVLETGRAVMLGQFLDTRGDLGDLEARLPDLALRFVRARDLLDAGAAGTPDGRQSVAAGFAELLAEIRGREGFAGFLKPPAVEALLRAGEHGPVVVCNVSRFGSDALAVHDGGVTRIALPDADLSAVGRQVNAFHAALAVADSSHVTPDDRIRAQATIRGILEWLWDAVAGPVLGALPPAAGSSGELPRLWWVPGGLLGLLPLHAAGHHPRGKPGAGAVPPTVMDRVVSSYSPTLRALVHARRPVPVGQAPASLIVSMPHTPDASPLPYAEDEALRVHGLLPRPELLLHRPPQGGSAGPAHREPSLEQVRSGLSRATIAHFACHGAAVMEDPAQSRLLLVDHRTRPFTVTELTGMRVGEPDLAYLSACATAFNGDVALIDESIHLAAGFQIAGFRNVVATQWKIGDRSASRIAESFYRALGPTGARLPEGGAARALHRVTRDLRDRFPLAPSLWGAYLHFGC